MSNINLKLKTSSIEINVNANTGTLITRDANSSITSAVPVMNSRPYDADRKALVRAIYIQSFNLELVLDSADRQCLRDLALRMAKELGDDTHAYYTGAYCEVRENNQGIEGWMDVTRVDGKVVSVGVGMGVGDAEWAHQYDLTNGPVPFNAMALGDPKFYEVMEKVVAHTVRHTQF